MATQFYDEIRFFGATVLFGAVAALCYDILRIWRRVWKRGLFAVSVQDFCFWFTFGVLAFRLMYLFNAGILRFYAFGGICVGACLYLWTLGRVFVKIGLKIVLFFTFPLRKGLQFLKKQFKLKFRSHTREKRKEDAHATTEKKEKKDRNLSSDPGSAGNVYSSQKRKRKEHRG